MAERTAILIDRYGDVLGVASNPLYVGGIVSVGSFVELTDVSVVSPASGDYIGYDVATGKYVNKPVSGTGMGDVTGPSGAVAGHFAALDSSGKIISDSGYAPASFGDVHGPSSSTARSLAGFSDTGGKTIISLSPTVSVAGVLDMKGEKIIGVAPPDDSGDVATKLYVDQFIQGVSWQPPVIAILAASPSNPADEDRYIIADSASGEWLAHQDSIATWWASGSQWVYSAPGDGWACYNADTSTIWVYNESLQRWVNIGSSGVPEAPNNANTYGRSALAWKQVFDVFEWSSVSEVVPKVSAALTDLYKLCDAVSSRLDPLDVTWPSYQVYYSGVGTIILAGSSGGVFWVDDTVDLVTPKGTLTLQPSGVPGSQGVIPPTDVTAQFNVGLNTVHLRTYSVAPWHFGVDEVWLFVNPGCVVNVLPHAHEKGTLGKYGWQWAGLYSKHVFAEGYYLNDSLLTAADVGAAPTVHNHPLATTVASGFMPVLNGEVASFMRGDGTWGDGGTPAEHAATHVTGGNDLIDVAILLSESQIIGGIENSLLGHDALSNVLETANYNVAIGERALNANTSGSFNTAIGNDALKSNTSANVNTAIGNKALVVNTTGFENTAVGWDAQFSNITGYKNTAVGCQSLNFEVSGGENTAVGHQALYSINGGNKNVGIGRSAGNNISQKVDAVNTIALGFDTYTIKDNQVVIGDLNVVETLLRGNVRVSNDFVAPTFKFEVDGSINVASGCTYNENGIPHVHSLATTVAPGFMPQLNGDVASFMSGDGTWRAEAGSQVNSDWSAVLGVASILNKPTIGTAANNLLQLDSSARIPGVDGSLLTGITASSVSISSRSSVATKRGQAVYIVTGNSALPDVALCDNTVTSKSRIFGLVVADGSIGDTISVRRSGVVNNVDTRTSNSYVNPNGETWVEGDLLFATTNGGLTNNRPTSGRIVKAGYSLKGSGATDSILLFPMENPVWVTCASGEDVVLRLGDAAGAKSVSIRDYANVEVASINSDGGMNIAAGQAYKIGGVAISAATLGLEKAAGSDIITGTDDYKYLTSKALKDAAAKRSIFLSLAGGWTGTTLPDNGFITTETSTNKVNLRGTNFIAAAANMNHEFGCIMPGNYDGGTITAKAVMFVPTSTDASSHTIIFGLQAVAFGDGDTGDTAYGTAQEVTLTAAASLAGKIKISSDSSAITIGNTPAANKWTQFRCYRKGDDTYTGDVTLMGWIISYGINKYSDA